LLRALKSYAAASSAKCAAVVPALVALLVESGADPGRADAAGEAPLHHAVLHVRHAARCDDCLRCLLHAGANPGAPPPLVARQSSADLHAADEVHRRYDLHRDCCCTTSRTAEASGRLQQNGGRNF
jgi:ankyrin repeat protein